MLLSPTHLTASVLTRFHRSRPEGPPDACWLWTGTIASNGYGFLHIGGRDGQHVGPHRIAWVLATQQTIPHRYHICHRCDVRLCCNPAHLFLGTSSDNIKDAVAKGHKPGGARIGISNGLAKLTDNHIRAMRAITSDGNISTRELARRFGVSQATAWKIIRRHAWKHVA